ncbi:hypothetical protein BDA96_03G275400 [Sorghum bicolor]|jgi:hypothetical protein|uniref:NAC domain-containing protein n=1 Tax=Sorghum bicolor TaxID=4558 RepID=A0A921UPU8_SORBI|nr:hypothetical protein BDA96_03G275400 [Sorghum bicolor]
MMLRSPSAAFQSHPSDLELVDSYLRTWVETGAKTGAFIHDADVYAADPADLTRQFPPAVACDGERAWYFYTPLRHKSLHGKRKTRTVATGSGCWHNEAKSKPVYMVTNGNQHQIGHRQSFSFVKKDTGVRVRTGWLMIELRLLKDGEKPEAEDSALGNRVLCKVYRSPRNPEPSGSGATASASAAAAAAPGHKAEADDDDDESSDATLDDNDYYDDDDSSNASLDAASGPKKRRADDVESSEGTVAAPSRHSKANDEISGGAAAAPGRKEKEEINEDSVETSAAAPPRKRKALDDESSDAARARKKKADGSSSPGAAPVSATEMQCPQCGTHLVVTLKKAESKSETAIAKDESASGTPPRGQTRGSSQKNVRFLQFL